MPAKAPATKVKIPKGLPQKTDCRAPATNRRAGRSLNLYPDKNSKSQLFYIFVLFYVYSSTGSDQHSPRASRFYPGAIFEGGSQLDALDFTTTVDTYSEFMGASSYDNAQLCSSRCSSVRGGNVSEIILFSSDTHSALPFVTRCKTFGAGISTTLEGVWRNMSYAAYFRSGGGTDGA